MKRFQSIENRVYIYAFIVFAVRRIVNVRGALWTTNIWVIILKHISRDFTVPAEVLRTTEIFGKPTNAV